MQSLPCMCVFILFVLCSRLLADNNPNPRTPMAFRKQFLAGHNNNRHLTSEEMENNIEGLPITENRLRELFNSYDTNQNGYLEMDEVKKIYKQYESFGLEPSDREVEEFIRKYAKSADNIVTFDEFCCIILNLAQR
jgi:hypothetical protein